jgi:Domain of unknown function (DUF4307)
MSILDSTEPADPLLDERYGTPPRWSRLIIVVVVALLTTAGVTWVIWAGLAHSNPPIEAQLSGFEVRNAHAVDVTLRIDRSDGDAARCDVYALDKDQTIVGERTIVVPAGDQDEVNATIRTEHRAIAADLRSCEVTDTPS